MKKLLIGVCAAVAAAVSAFAEGAVEVVSGASRTFYETLEEAAQAAPNNATIKVNADIGFTGVVWLGGRTNLKLTSGEGGPYRVKRTAEAGTLRVMDGTKVGQLTVSNLILDGGAVWTNPFADCEKEDDFLANTGIVGTDHFITGGGNEVSLPEGGKLTSKGQTITLGEGTVIENVACASGKHVLLVNTWCPTTLGAGAVIRDCRSESIVSTGWGGPQFYLDGGTITGCFSKNLRGVVGATHTSTTQYLKGGTITGNVVTEVGVMRIDGNYSKLGLGGSSAPLIVKDNLHPDKTLASVVVASTDRLKICGALAAGSCVVVGYPEGAVPSTLEATKFGVLDASYGGVGANVVAIRYQGNPVDGVNYVGRIDGANLVWADEQGQYEIEQGEVFEVWDAANERWVGYDRLENAIAAAPAGGVIELVDNALYDVNVKISKDLTIRSRGVNRYTLKRFKPCMLQLQNVDMGAPYTVTMTNLVVDGGAVWANQDGLADASGTGVTGSSFAELSRDGESHKVWLELQDVELVNFRFDSTLFSLVNGAMVLVGKGTRIHDCRQNADGGQLFQFRSWGTSVVTFLGGEMTRSYADYLFNGGKVLNVDAGAVTGNVVRTGVCAASFKVEVGRIRNHEDQSYARRSEPGRFLLRDNVTTSGEKVGLSVAAADFRVWMPLDSQSVFQLASGEAGEACAAIKSDNNSKPGDTDVLYPWVIENVANPILRGAVDGTSIVWAQTAVVGRPAALSEETARSGTLRVAGTEPLDESVGASEGYALFTCAAGFTGEFENVVIDDGLIAKEAHRARWKLLQSANEVRLVYRAPGLMLIVR